jgi:hypothetical protein
MVIYRRRLRTATSGSVLFSNSHTRAGASPSILHPGPFQIPISVMWPAKSLGVGGFGGSLTGLCAPGAPGAVTNGRLRSWPALGPMGGMRRSAGVVFERTRAAVEAGAMDEMVAVGAVEVFPFGFVRLIPDRIARRDR